MHYKAPNNSIHFIPSTEFEYLLPSGSIQITDEEAKALLPQPPAPTYQELRVAAYPSIGDQLDALYHAGVFPADMAAKILEIKERFPK